MWIEKILGLHYILFLKTNSRKIKRWRTTTPLKKIESGGLCVRWVRFHLFFVPLFYINLGTIIADNFIEPAEKVACVLR
jgi:hypothetical protein